MKYERGHRIPSFRSGLRLAAALGISIDELCHIEGPKKKVARRKTAFTKIYSDGRVRRIKIRRKKKPKPPRPPHKPKINGEWARPWQERDHIVPPEPPPGAKEFGWRSRIKEIPTRSEKMRVRSDKDRVDTSEDQEDAT